MRRGTAVFAAVVAAAAAAALSATAAPTSASSRSVTMHLVEKQIGFNFVDNPPRQGHNAAPLMGDQFAFASESVNQIAIVGGTGAYEGVTGSIASHSRGENSPFSDDTVHLIFP